VSEGQTERGAKNGQGIRYGEEATCRAMEPVVRPPTRVTDHDLGRPLWKLAWIPSLSLSTSHNFYMHIDGFALTSVCCSRRSISTRPNCPTLVATSPFFRYRLIMHMDGATYLRVRFLFTYQERSRVREGFHSMVPDKPPSVITGGAHERSKKNLHPLLSAVTSTAEKSSSR
jgi:hypothetical protein